MITGTHHFSFTVSNLEDALHFFCDLLGLEATPIREVTGEFIQKIVNLPGTSLRIANVALPEGNSIELVEYLVPKGNRIDLRTCNPGVAHIAFKVYDIQKMYEELSSKDVQFNNAPVQSPSGPSKGWGLCYLKGPDGITIEFMQPPRG